MGDGMAAENSRPDGAGEPGEGDVVERSAVLDATYDEVLKLVTRTADFVGAVRAGAVGGFDFGVGAAYTVESMRHTTRLMQVMAWLFTQRAVDSGEMTADEARDPKYRLGAAEICLAHPVSGTEQLPRSFREMMDQSDQIYRRIRRIADQLERPVQPAQQHPVHRLMEQFGTDGGDNSRMSRHDDANGDEKSPESTD